MDDLIKYLNFIGKIVDGFKDAPKQVIMEEICNVATNNWVESGNPKLTVEQLNKVMLRVISRGTTLN